MISITLDAQPAQPGLGGCPRGLLRHGVPAPAAHPQRAHREGWPWETPELRRWEDRAELVGRRGKIPPKVMGMFLVMNHFF